MRYMKVYSDGGWKRLQERPVMEAGVAVYGISEELYDLLTQWFNTPPSTDDLLSGVIADYLEDHREVVTGSAAADDSPNYGRMIEYLRLRFAGSDLPY